MPPARVDRKGEVKARNELLLQVGAVNAVKEGLIPLRDFCKLDHCINEMQARLNKPKTMDHQLPDENTWYYGEPGTGKTSSVINRYEDDGLYLKPLNKWWNGYAYQQTILVDDIDPDHGKWIAGYLKIWADRYPFQAEMKGTSALIRPKRVIVTSNYHPRDVFQRSEDVDAIRRRFRIV
jgi:hypothetical protein